MERSVSESFDHVSQLNNELERLVNTHLNETAEQVEQYVRTYLDGISSEKDSVLAQLTELWSMYPGIARVC